MRKKVESLTIHFANGQSTNIPVKYIRHLHFEDIINTLDTSLENDEIMLNTKKIAKTSVITLKNTELNDPMFERITTIEFNDIKYFDIMYDDNTDQEIYVTYYNKNTTLPDVYYNSNQAFYKNILENKDSQLVIGDKHAPYINGQKQKESYYGKSIYDLFIPSHIQHPLNRAGYRTIEDIVDTTQSELSKIKQFGPAKLSFLKKALHEQYGVSLKP